VEINEIPTGKPRIRLKAGRDRDSLTPLAFSPDLESLATSSYDGAVKLWDLTTGTVRTTITLSRVAPSPATGSGTTDSGLKTAVAAAYSADGATLAVSTIRDHSVTLWDTETGKRLTTLTTDPVTSLAFSPDNTTLATGHSNGSGVGVVLWDLATKRPRTGLTGPTGAVTTLTFSPDGTTLAAGSTEASHSIRIWDTTTGHTRATLTGHTQHVTSMTFTPNGHTLATSSADHTIRLWDLPTRHTRAIITDDVTSMAFTPDGGTLVALNNNPSIRLWNTPLPGTADTSSTICKAIHRDLTHEEQTLYLPGPKPQPACPHHS